MNIQVVDMFCGAGGTSTGLYAAADELGIGVNLLAINHWKIAIATHSVNHNHARHLCETLDSVDPRKIVLGGRLHLMVASPECTHHSNARGGKPMSDQSRASAWHVLRWAEALRVDNIIVENVREFMSWGPLGANGRPLKNRKGETFQAFLTALRSLGYTVEHRILNAADYGDPTTRERLFVLARRGNKPVRWPEPTHTRTPSAELFGQIQPWRAAREIIDWTIPGQSIFERKRPLADNTMRRIVAGLEKFGGPELEPFLIVLRGHNAGRSLSRPMPAVTGHGAGAVVQPMLVQYYGNGQTTPTSAPLPTVTSKDHFALVEPFVVNISHSKSAGTTRSVNKPLPTVVTTEEFALCAPQINGQRLDIRFRMLQPHELAAAQGFPKGYKFTGTREQQVKQIGNAVPTNLARALCRAMLSDYAPASAGREE